MYTITVTSLSDSGTGSLREAIALANAYTGTDEIQILIDESLAGQAIELSSSLPSINKACSLIAPASGIVLSGYGLTTAVDLHMENVTQPSMVIEKCIALSGSGNVFTGSGQVLEIYDVYVNLQNFSAVATHDDAYIKVSSALMAYPMQFNGTTTLGILGKGLNVYKFDSCLFIMDGACLNLESGVIMDCPEGVTVDYYYEPSILCAENATFRLGNSSLEVMGEADISRCIIDGTIVVSSYCSLRGSDVVFTGSGKVIELENADIDLSNLSASATQDDAYIGITNGSVTSKITLGVLGEGLDTYKSEYDILIRSGAELTLEDGVTTESQGLEVLEGGKLVAGASHLLLGTSNLSVSGEAELTGTMVASTNYEPVTVSGGGNLTMTGCDVSTIGTRGNITLQDVTVTEQLCIRDGTVSGSGVVFTGSGPVILLDSADVSLTNLSATATQEDAYIRINDRELTGKRTFGILGEGLDTYKSEYDILIRSGAELTLEDGVTTEGQGLAVLEGGKLVAGAAEIQLGKSCMDVYGEAELKGATISSTNAYAVWVHGGGKLTMTGCDVSKISTSGNITLQDVTVTEQLCIRDGTVSGSGVVFTGSGAVILLDSANVSLTNLSATATQDDAYIVIAGHGMIEDGSPRSLYKLGKKLDTYRMADNYLALYQYENDEFGNRIKSKVPIILESGVKLTESGGGFSISVRKGGRAKADVYSVENLYGDIYDDTYDDTYDDGKHWQISGPVEFDGVTVTGDISYELEINMNNCVIYGDLTSGEICNVEDATKDRILSNTEVHGDVRGVDVFESCTVHGDVATSYSREDARLTDSTIEGTLNISWEDLTYEYQYHKEAEMEDVVCQTLSIGSGVYLQTSGTGITLTGKEAMTIYRYDPYDWKEEKYADIDEFLSSFSWSTTHQDAHCVLIGGVAGELKKDSRLPGGYVLAGGVGDGQTLTFEEGLCVSLAQLDVEGNLEIRNQKVADAFRQAEDNYYGFFTVYSTGSALLENTNITGNGVSIDVYGGKLHVEGGNLNIESLTLHSEYQTSGTVCLKNVNITAQDGLAVVNRGLDSHLMGTLELDGCMLVDTDVLIEEGGALKLTGSSGIRTLTLAVSSAEQIIYGNDLSDTRIVLTGLDDGETLDLSGNYWGTTDLTEIWAKIDGDKSRVVIDGIMLTPPPRYFTLTNQSTEWLKIADTAGQLTLKFNREIDANSVSSETLGLRRDDGSVVSIKEYIVEGKSVTLVFDTLPVGQYSLKVTNGLKDTSGNTYSMPSGFENGITYEVYDSSINTPPRLLLVLPNSTLADRFRSVDLFFNQILDADSITVDKVHVFAASGEEIAITNFYETETSGRTCYRVEFDTVTETGTYAVTVDASVRNEYGVEMSAPFEQNIYVASPDLQLADEISFTSATPGRYATITYTVENRGDGAAVGSWTDSIYLCRSEAWDESEAILFGRVTRSKENLASGATYSASVSGILPGLGDERYYVFVRTDEASRVSESNEQNNDRRASDPMELIVPELSVGVSLDDATTSANELLYYCYTAEVSGTLAFALKNADGKICVWESEGDASVSLGRVVKSENEQTLYFSAEAGQKYYISVKPNRTGQFAMELRETSFALVSVSVNSVSAGHTTTMSLVGTELTEGMNVYLEDAQGNRYDATNVVVKNPVEATVQFELPEGLEPGMSLTLHAENPGGELAVLETPLNVATYGDVVDLSFDDMDDWSYQRVGYVWRSHLNVENARGADLVNAIILVTDTAEDFAMYYSYAEGSIRDRSALMFLGGAGDSSPNQLLAGEKDKLDIFVKNYRSSEGRIEAHVFDPTDTTAIAPGMWEQIASALRPATCEDETWAAWWSNMQPRIGTTVADFVSFVREMQQVSGKNTGSSLADLVDDIMQNHGEYAPSAGVWGALTDADGEGVQNAIVELYRITDGERELVSSLLTGEYGYFCFGKLEQGAQYELVCSESFMLGGNMVNSVTFVQEGVTTEQRWEMPPTASVKIAISGITGQLSEEAAVYLTSADGRMVLLTYRNDAWVADGVLPGDYTLSAVEDGYSFAEKIVTVTEVSAENTFTISATRVVTLQGRLLNADGSMGVEDVCVALCQNGQVVAMAQTDESGHYVLSYIREGDYELRLDDADGRLLTEITANNEQIDDILLNQGHTVSGSLRGAALGSTVSLYEGDVCKYTTLLKADGTYVFSGVAEGEYRLLVNDEEIDSSYVLILSGGETRAEVPEKTVLQGARLTGTVNGMDAEYVVLSKDGKNLAVAYVDLQGRFGFTVGEVGSYTLQAFNAETHETSAPTQVEVVSLQQNLSTQLTAADGSVKFGNVSDLSESATCTIFRVEESGELRLCYVLHGRTEIEKMINAVEPGNYVACFTDVGRRLELSYEVTESTLTNVDVTGWQDSLKTVFELTSSNDFQEGDAAYIYVYHSVDKSFVTALYMKGGETAEVYDLPAGVYDVVVLGVDGTTYQKQQVSVMPGQDNTWTLTSHHLTNSITGTITGVDEEFVEYTKVVLYDDAGCVVSLTTVDDEGKFVLNIPETFRQGCLDLVNTATMQSQQKSISVEDSVCNVVMMPQTSHQIIIPDSYDEEQVSSAINTPGTFRMQRAVQMPANSYTYHELQARFNCLHDRLLDFNGGFYSKNQCCDDSAFNAAVVRQYKALTPVQKEYAQLRAKRADIVGSSIGLLSSLVGMALALPALKVSVGMAFGAGIASAVASSVTQLIIDWVNGNPGDSEDDNYFVELEDNLNTIIDYLAPLGDLQMAQQEHDAAIKLYRELQAEMVTFQALKNKTGNYANIDEGLRLQLLNNRAQSLVSYVDQLDDVVNSSTTFGANVRSEVKMMVEGVKNYAGASNVQSGVLGGPFSRLNMDRISSVIKGIEYTSKVLTFLQGIKAFVDGLNIGRKVREYFTLKDDLVNHLYELELAIEEAEREKALLNDCIATQGDDCKPDPDAELPHKNFQSFDPNDIYGPVGYGAQNWIGRKEMRFEVVCENIPEENIAHAAMVTIKQQIDAAYDYSTFRLGDMMIAGNYIEVEGDVQHFQERVDWTETLGVLVDVNAFFDADTGEVTWEFVAIDPETGWVVGDPFMGLLAPNYNPPEGDGGVTYYVTPKETAESGTVMQAEAEIIFDFNEPIDTPLIKYTLDGDNPVAVVQSVSESAAAGYLLVRWGGTDVGSGVKSYDVYVSVDGGEWQLWQDDISFDRALYAKLVGEHSYAFYAVAMDYAGNAEAVTEVVSAESSLVSTHTDAESSLTVNSVQAVRAGDALTLSIAFSEQAVCADWAVALLVSTSAQNIDLSTGTFRYDATTHVLTWVGTVAGVPDGAQATVRLTDGAVTDANGLPFGSSVPAYTAPIELAGVVGSTYAAPALVDYNGDGLLDVLVGEVAENGKGRIRIYLNEGTAEVASFATFIYATTAENAPLTLEACGCQGAIVRFADITGDGKDEMVVGLADGTIRIFTAAEGGYWTDSGELSCSVGGESGIVDAGTRAAIEFVDANDDGRTDMLVGTGDGNVLLYLNTSAEGAAAFDAGRYLHDAAGRIDVGSRATVATGDFDGDGLWDMLLGTADGTVLFYRNEGSTGTPLFGAAETVFAGDALLDMSSETNRVRIDTGDLNGDGIDDLVVGQSDGSVKVLYGQDAADLVGRVTVGTIPLPDAPQNVQVAVHGGRVTLSWTPVTVDGESDISYEISYLPAGGAPPVVVNTVGTEYTLELDDATYTVQVRALNLGKGGDWSSALSVTVDTVPPAVPGALRGMGGETSSILSWSAVAEAACYEIRYRKTGSEAWRTLNTREAEVSLEAMSPADYEWQVRALDAAGNASAWTSSASFVVTGTAPATEQYWASGLLFDSSGNVTGGYYDVNKSGSTDSNLCWAAATSNMLAWWQEDGLTSTVVPDAPQGAENIYATFRESWDNSSGVDVYGLIWWMSGESTSSGYKDYVSSHYRGDSSTGGYYNQYYTEETISQHVAQVSLAGAGAAALSETWRGIYNACGMIALGVYRSVSGGGQLMGGHSLTLWGFERDIETGEILEIYVTDSDDSMTTLDTLSVEYDATTGYYTIAQEGARLNGYVLGSYTWLKPFTGVDIVNPEVTVAEPVLEKLADGRIRVTLSWSCSEAAAYTLTVDGTSYNLGSATSHSLELVDGEHSYSVKATDAAGNAGTATGSFALDATAPGLVSGLQARVDEDSVAVSWSSVTDAASYSLQYALKADFSDALTISGITEPAYTLTGVPATGMLYVRVMSTDAADNSSNWSAVAQCNLDVSAPDAVQGLEVLAQGTTASLSWDAASDASGIACYHLQLAVDGDFSKAQTLRVQELENTFFSLQADTDYQWRVAAEDGAGNVGSWAQGNAFRTGAGEVESIAGAREVELSALSGGEYSAATRVYDWVGGDDAVDYFRITAAAEGAYCVSVDAESLESAVMVSVGFLGAGGAFSVQQELILAPGAAQEELPGMHVSKGESLYVKVESLGDTDDATFYELKVEGSAPSEVSGRVTRNNSVSKATVTVADGRSISGWVGAGDASDYYRVTLQNSGSLSMALDELEGSARLRFFRQRTDGSLAHLDSRVVKGGSELERTLSLTAGTYYLEVAAVDGGLGCCNTTYRLTLEEEARQRRESTTSNLASM